MGSTRHLTPGSRHALTLDVDEPLYVGQRQIGGDRHVFGIAVAAVLVEHGPGDVEVGPLEAQVVLERRITRP